MNESGSFLRVESVPKELSQQASESRAFIWTRSRVSWSKSSLALIADLIAQVPGSQIVLPLNAITALIGAPAVVWVILRRRNLRETFAG